MTRNDFHTEHNQTPPTTREPLAAPARLQGAELQTFLRRKARRLKTRRRFAGAGIAMIMYSGVLIVPVDEGIGSPMPTYYCLIVVPFALLAAFMAYYRLTRRTVQAEIEDMVAETGVQAVGTLFEMLRYADEPQVKTTIRHALTRLLPQMTAADANVLTPYARRTMRRWLEVSSVDIGLNSYVISLRIAALKALEQVGDSSDIPVVERLAMMTPRTPGQEKIKQAAIECLPMLRANCGEVETARTLLRASQAETTDPDTLLRPASGSGQTGSAELLRGSDSPDAAE